MKCQPMLYVDDVRATSSFYCGLLDADHDHDGPDFDRILVDDQVVLMLHAVKSHNHGDVDLDVPRGGGTQLWFVVPDVDAVYERARQLGATRLTEPVDNPLAHWRECSMRDPNGYAIAVASYANGAG